MMGAPVNRAFLAKAIDRMNGNGKDKPGLALGDPFCDALHQFVWNAGVMVWDDTRALFWVEHPHAGWQVAVWAMPVAQQFEPMPP